MAGTTPVHHSSISYYQGRDIRGRFQSGLSHLTDDSGIIIYVLVLFYLKNSQNFSSFFNSKSGMLWWCYFSHLDVDA